MKTIKTFALIPFLVAGITTSVFASWWNPLTWSFLKKTQVHQVQQNPASSVLVVQNNQIQVVNTATNTNINKKEEVLITSYGMNDVSVKGVVLTVKDISGKVWNVDYKDVKFFESWVDTSGEHFRPGDFNKWLQTINALHDPRYDGPGVPGGIKITGEIDNNNIVHATKISQHVQ
jgi:hypothetical protein